MAKMHIIAHVATSNHWSERWLKIIDLKISGSRHWKKPEWIFQLS